mgnify:CR=1 FL=1
MKQKIICQGAEAILYQEKNKLIKHRIPKSYRIKEIDDKLRKFRTRREGKILEKASINVPKIFKIDDKDMKIEMEFIPGKLLKDILDDLSISERNKICKQIGEEISKLHEQSIIHGDLTTSNLIYYNKKIYFIDFGLSFFSHKIEDKAVDLHLLKQALESKHYKHFESTFKAILSAYKNKEVLSRLEIVEKRGRYKRKSF